MCEGCDVDDDLMTDEGACYALLKNGLHRFRNIGKSIKDSIASAPVVCLSHLRNLNWSVSLQLYNFLLRIKGEREGEGCFRQDSLFQIDWGELRQTTVLPFIFIPFLLPPDRPSDLTNFNQSSQITN